jgi:hypothetical protein
LRMVKDFSFHCSPHNLGSRKKCHWSHGTFQCTVPRQTRSSPLGWKGSTTKTLYRKVRFSSDPAQLDILYNSYNKTN